MDILHKSAKRKTVHRDLNIFALPEPIHSRTDRKTTFCSGSLCVWEEPVTAAELSKFCLSIPFLKKTKDAVDCFYKLIRYSAGYMLSRCFLRKNPYTPNDTILSKALPTPNSKAIPVRVGTQIPVKYNTNAVP